MILVRPELDHASWIVLPPCWWPDLGRLVAREDIDKLVLGLSWVEYTAEAGTADDVFTT